MGAHIDHHAHTCTHSYWHPHSGDISKHRYVHNPTRASTPTCTHRDTYSHPHSVVQQGQGGPMGMGVHKSAIIPAGYPYNHHLLEFERRSGTIAGVSHPWLQLVSSPLRHSEWSDELEGHPDAVLATYVLNGIYNGFHIGFDRSKRCKPSRSNMKSALDNAGVVGQYLEEEVRLGRMVGPIPLAWVPAGTQLSPI